MPEAPGLANLEAGAGEVVLIGRACALARIRCITHAAQLRLGNLADDIPMVGEGAQRLAEAIAATLFVEDRGHHWRLLTSYDEPEHQGDEWSELARWDPPLGG
jgi:hypothetical protein